MRQRQCPDADPAKISSFRSQTKVGASVLRPDVVVVDLRLPETNGIDACRRLKATDPRIKVVIVTAGDDARIRTAAIEAGAAAFVPKSALDSLLATIRDA